jgi:DNA-binding MarR family transcriptional regulator
MSPRPNTRPSAALEALLSLFGGMKQAMRHQLQSDGGPATAPMLLRMLQLCKRQPGITQQGMALITGRDKGQVARLVKELVDEGLLTREDHPDDRRSHRLQPTAAGLAAVERFETADAAVAELIFGELSTAELTALTEQLTRLKSRLDEHLTGADGRQ